MYDYAIRAAFEDAKQDNYQHPVGLDPDMVAQECADLIDAVDQQTDGLGFDNDEDFREHIMRESFVRAFEAGLAVGLEAGEEGIEVRLHLDRDTVAGLVQQALHSGVSLKE